ncbi:uncharacterized protein LOC130948992 [Arachis stenosperma]|uniref:uncharacterized protein LOC130948992 n=1 Tax=Arachis stenosperma TaxID=217475 RepID=UPI0025AD9888|nr:uncharacterized protein LOC130948992 [Arachis stenosperma]
MVASNSIEDLFNMQATCKVFLGAASSDAVYKHATMSYLDGPERRFFDRCVKVGNVDAILRQGFVEYFQFRRHDKGMELLARASTEGSVEAGYLCAHLLMFGHEEEEEVQKGCSNDGGYPYFWAARELQQFLEGHFQRYHGALVRNACI